MFAFMPTAQEQSEARGRSGNGKQHIEFRQEALELWL